MKILFFNSLYQPNIIGGAERSTQLLVEEIAKHTNHIPVLVTTTNKEDYIDYVNGVKVYYLNYRQIYWMYYSKQKPIYVKPLWHLIDIINPFIMNQVDRIIKKEHPTLVHTNNLSGIQLVHGSLRKNIIYQ